MSPDVDEFVVPHEQTLQRLPLLVEVDSITHLDVAVLNELRSLLQRPANNLKNWVQHVMSNSLIERAPLPVTVLGFRSSLTVGDLVFAW
jgi:hypothetical protein